MNNGLKNTLLASAIILTSFSLAENAVNVTRSTPLFLKPAFELTHKDQVLLDIIHSKKIASTKEDFSYLEEGDSGYPEPFEKAYERYLDAMGDLRPSRARYLSAIESAGNYLLSLLFPETYGKKEETTKDSVINQSYQAGNLATLLIGIDYEGTRNELQNCIHDIEHVQDQFLVPQLKAKKDNMIFMSDHKYGTDLYPTAKNIRRQFDKFVDQLNKTKYGYFHYSGHGSYSYDYSGEEKDGYDEVLVPVDCDYSGYISDDEVFETLVKGLKPDVKLTVTADCCHSGTVMDLPFKWYADGSFSVEKELSEEELAALPDVVMLSGCKDSQTSADGGFIEGETKGAGAMTAAYLQTLKDYNFVLTYKQLLEGVHKRLKSEGFTQKPQLSSTRKINLDDYFLTTQVALRP